MRAAAVFIEYPAGEKVGQKAILARAIVAHSMGGVVVREAMNRLTGDKREARVKRLITVASPLGGHPGVKGAVNAPLVLPSWRNLDPDGIRTAHSSKASTAGINLNRSRPHG